MTANLLKAKSERTSQTLSNMTMGLGWVPSKNWT